MMICPVLVRSLAAVVLLLTAAHAAPDDLAQMSERIQELRNELSALEQKLEREMFGNNPGPVASSGRAAPVWKPGTEVQVQWGGQWWRARVEAVHTTGVRIHYLGWDPVSDEIVPRDRLQQKGAGLIRVRPQKFRYPFKLVWPHPAESSGTPSERRGDRLSRGGRAC